MKQRSTFSLPLAMVSFASLCFPAHGQDAKAPKQPFRSVVTWAASEQAPEPQNGQPGLDAAELDDTTIRQIVHLSLGGNTLRLHLSNAAGAQPLTIDAVYLARPVSAGSSAILPNSTQVVRFGGRETVTVPAGAEYISDPVSFAAGPLSDLTVSFHLLGAPRGQTAHPAAQATAYLLQGSH